MPASGPVSSRSSPISRLTRVDLPAFGRPTMAMRIGLSRSSAASSSASTSGGGGDRGRRRGRPCPRRARPRSASARRGRARTPRSAPASPGPALGLVGDQDHRLVRAAQHFGEHPVQRRHALAGVDHEQRPRRPRRWPARSGARMRASRLSSVDVLEAGGVDQLQVEVAEPAGADSGGRGSRPAGRRRCASLRPASRLNRVDLPTFGRPTMASLSAMRRLPAD